LLLSRRICSTYAQIGSFDSPRLGQGKPRVVTTAVAMIHAITPITPNEHATDLEATPVSARPNDAQVW
jgi:hypothetical protein